ncbi:ferric reductase NAD binding domain-containing protein [Lipomyces mesembrius]
MQSLAVVGIFLLILTRSAVSAAEASCHSACQTFLETFTTECAVDDFACMCTDDRYLEALLSAQKIWRWVEYYGNILSVYWVIPIISSFVYRTALGLYPRKVSKPGSLVTFFRKHIILPATFSRKHVSPIRFFGVSWNVMPLRWQTLLIVGFVLLNVILIFVHHNIIRESHEAWAIPAARFYANRSGIMATTMIPLLFLFGGRNNIMTTVTGWSHETFNMFHRWTGRMMFFQSLVHGAGFTSYYIMDGGYETYYYNMYKNYANLWGIIILTLAGVIMLQAAYPFRHYWYEAFLVCHVVLHGYHGYTYAALAIWMFDRFLRIVRVVLAGATTHAEIYAHGNATHLIVKPSIHFKAQPGQYAFLYVMRHKFWESHPFSIMDTKADGSYIFVAKAQAGMTRRLLKSAAHVPGNGMIRVWVEGPYGKTYPIARYETVLLIAGGIGVTAVMSYALDLKRRARSGQHILFYWTIRESESLNWVKEQLEEVAQDGFVDIRIFITAEWSTNSSTSDMSNEKNSGDIASGSRDSVESSRRVSICPVPKIVPVNYGQRPDMSKVIEETIKQAHGSVAVVSCGPGSLVDKCRSAVADNVEKGTGRVDYFEDAFSCA